MTNPTLTLACVATDRSRPIARGEINVSGFDLEINFGEPEQIFREALRNKTHAISEMSMASHIVTTARGDSAYIGVPVFLSRAFRHSGVFVRGDRGINTLADLKGKTVGVPEYQQTAAMWIRGMMLDDFGVSAAQVKWQVGAINQPGPGERIKLDLPPQIEATAIDPEATLNELLADGVLDAVLSPREPLCLDDPAVPVRRLFEDTTSAEREYCQRTGFFPIMHCLAVRRDIADLYPQLPAALFRAFAQAKALSLDELTMGNVLRVSLPWLSDLQREFSAMLGGNPWPYGFKRNLEELTAMTRYANSDGIAVRAVAPEELFHSSTLELEERGAKGDIGNA